MPTTSDYLTQLQQDREDLIDNLETKGITGLSGDETFTELVPEVLNIPSGGGTSSFLVLEEDNEGYPTKVKIQNMTQLPRYYCYSRNGGIFSKVTNIELPSNLTKVGDCCFQGANLSNLQYLPSTLIEIGNYAFSSSNVTLKTIPDDTILKPDAFYLCNYITQMSVKKYPTSNSDNYSENAIFGACRNLIAFWCGFQRSLSLKKQSFNGCTNMRRLYIDQPRATVEANADYQYAFSNNAFSTDIIICNDDDDFITKEQFDAIDWSTYNFE